MTTLARFVLVSLALGSATFARAESAPARTALRPTSPIIAALDANRDGTLSAQELATAPAMLSALDLNDDGTLSPDELRVTTAEGRPLRTRQGSATFNVVLTLDANHDGDIQSLEIANAVSSLKRLDRNGDGALTPDELRPTLVASTRV